MRAASENIYHERILRVLVHIEQHLDERLSLGVLAKISGFSPFHFHRIFHGMTGESLRQHIKRLRMQRAAHRLRHTKQPVTAIAFDAGYQTPESFSRTFHSAFGQSPSGFRKSAAGRMKGDLMIDVKIVRRAVVEVAFMRYVGPPDEVGRAWEKLSRWAGQRGIFGRGTEFLGVWHDDPQVAPPRRLRCDVCATLSRKIDPEGEVGVREIAAGDYAMTRHRGSYEKLAETYAMLCGVWAPRSGRELAGAPSLEFYRNSPQTTRPEDLVTDIYLPLE